MMNDKIIKIAGLALSAIGLGVGILSDWVKEQKTDATIEKKVSEAISKMRES